MTHISRYGVHLLALVGAIVYWHSVGAEEVRIPFKIDEATAQRLAAEAVFGKVKYLDFFDYDEKLNRPFLEYYGINPPPRQGGFGYFAVNPWTGDVWALWGCHRLSTPALRKSQAAIRRRFTAEELKEYARLRLMKPECVVED